MKAHSPTSRLGALAAIVVLAIGCSSTTDAVDESAQSPPSPRPVPPTTLASGPDQLSAPLRPPVASPSAGPALAAVEIVEWKQDLITMDVSDAETALRQIAHPDRADEIVSATVGDLRRRDEVVPAGLTLRVAVIELAVLDESDDAATVSLWTVEIVTGAGSTRVTYNTTTLELGLVDGSWLLIAQSTVPGPVPTPAQEPFSPAAFEAALAGFNDPADQ